jgi:hypothetical protein
VKRDMDLIRAILLEVEKSPSPGGCRIEIPAGVSQVSLIPRPQGWLQPALRLPVSYPASMLPPPWARSAWTSLEQRRQSEHVTS